MRWAMKPALSRITPTAVPSAANRACAASRMAGLVSGVVISVRRRPVTSPNRQSMATVRCGSSPWPTQQVVASAPSGVTMHRALSLGV